MLSVAALCLSTFTVDLAYSQTNVAPSSAKSASHWGLHGMLVFGDKDSLYASHLPMFHAPHDRQLIFRFHLGDAKLDAQLRAQFEKSASLWTLEPEEFDIDRLQIQAPNPLKQFEAQLFSGHFERGGQPRWPKQTIIVDEILVFQDLSGTNVVQDANQGSTHSTSKYYVIGAGTQRYLMKHIDRRPDFDTLVTIRNKASAKVDSNKPIASISLNNQVVANKNMAQLNHAIEQQLGKHWRIGKTIYFETEDLK